MHIKTTLSISWYRFMAALNFVLLYGTQVLAQSTDPAPYCAPAAINMTSGTCTKSNGADAYRLTSVKLADGNKDIIDVTDSSCHGTGNTDVYRHWTSPGTLVAGNQYTLMIETPASVGNDTVYVSAWLDFNQNNRFTDISEQLILTYDLSAKGIKLASMMKMPRNIPYGKTRLRIRVEKGKSGIGDSCTISSGFGETWDFDVNVVKDTVRPVITMIQGSPYPIELSCLNSPYVDPGASAYDNIEGDISPRMIIFSNVDTRRIGDYFVSYIVTDADGNSDTAIRKVLVRASKPVPGQISADFINYRYVFSITTLSPVLSGSKWSIDGMDVPSFEDFKSQRSIVISRIRDTFDHQVCVSETYCNDTTIIYCMKFNARDAQNLKLKKGIEGHVYRDKNMNCLYDTTDAEVGNMSLHIYDNTGKLHGIERVFSDGSFFYECPPGIYRVELDSELYAMAPICGGRLRDTIVTVDTSLPVSGLTFPIGCSDPDMVINYPLIKGNVFPGRIHQVQLFPYEQNDVFGKSCYGPLAGTVQLRYSGPVKYKGPASGSLSPVSVNGNLITYAIADVSDLDKKKRISPEFVTDTTAQGADRIELEIKLIPSQADADTSNNHISMHYLVRNSLDPNFKEVSSAEIETGYKDWLVYTIHFQNTGSAAAYNIRLQDTLDPLLDAETFHVLNASHPMRATLRKDVLAFNFVDIMLPDSFSDEEHSHGFVQYRIKPLRPLKENEKIHNTAFIYFDYNTPVVTNTIVSEVSAPGSSIEQIQAGSVAVYPNPGQGLFILQLSPELAAEGLEVKVFNLLGEIIYSGNARDVQTVMDMRNQPAGAYVLQLSGPSFYYSQLLLRE